MFVFGIIHRQHYKLLVFRASQDQPALRISAMAGTPTSRRQALGWSPELGPIQTRPTWQKKLWLKEGWMDPRELVALPVPASPPSFCFWALTTWLGQSGARAWGQEVETGLHRGHFVHLSAPVAPLQICMPRRRGHPPFVSICRAWLLCTFLLPLQPQWKRRLPPPTSVL